METLLTLLMEFMSKVLGAVQTRHSQNKRTEDEGFGIRSFVSLGKWINANKGTVKAAIANDTEMFNLIMKQATQTLKTYIKTGVWNKVYWVVSHDSIGRYNLRIHFVWTPQNGRTMTKAEDNILFGKIRQVGRDLQKKGYDVDAWGVQKHAPATKDFYSRGKISVENTGLEKEVTFHHGNVFQLLADFFGHQLS